MDLAVILAGQVAVMFLLLATGVICKKAAIMNEESARTLSNVLLVVVIPCMLVRSSQQERNLQQLPALAATFVLAILFHILAIFVANRVIKDPGDGGSAWQVSKLGIVFSNAGFMGFPLLQATGGESALLYGAVFIGVFNAVSWIWCTPTLNEGKRMSIGQLLRTPAIIAFFVAIFLYLLNIRLPIIVYTFLDHMSSVNTPLSMVIIGVFLASVSPRDALRDKLVYIVLFARNLLLPLLTLAILWVTRVTSWLPEGRAFAIAFLVMASCPAAANTILMSARFGRDSAHGAKLVAVSTAVSILSMPLIVMLGDMIL